MILGATHEDPSRIKDFISSLSLPSAYADYKAYSFVIPDKYMYITPMLDIKKSELFGPYLSLRAFSEGRARHANFIMRSKDELVISIGVNNHYYGHPDHRMHIDLPAHIDFAGVMAVTYYLTGKIQESKPSYYKENINSYAKDYGPKAYGKTEPFDVIVPGSMK